MDPAGASPLFPHTHPLGAQLRRIWVFPGQGSQLVGMGKELYASSPAYRDTFDRGAAALASEGVDLHKLVFEGPSEQLTRTLHAQPALLISNIAFLEHLRVEEGIAPAPDDLMAGHSLGEWAAYVAASGLTLEQGVLAVYWRGRCMEEAFPYDPSQPKPMAVVLGLTDEIVVEICQSVSRDGHTVVAANFNCPGQVAISGHPAAVQEASGRFRERGAQVVEIPVAAPFHSPLMNPARESFIRKLDELGIRIAPPRHTVIANFTGEPMVADGDHLGSLLNQLTGAVRWNASMVRAWELGVVQMVAVEIVGKVLGGLAKKIFSAEVPVQSVDPRIPMHRQALRFPPGLVRTTVFPPDPRMATRRLLRYSYSATAIAKSVKQLMAEGGASNIALALEVLDNPYNLARETGMRQLAPYKDLTEVAAAVSEKGFSWPEPLVRDLPTEPIPDGERQILETEIFDQLDSLGLSPIEPADLVYYVESRWRGEPKRLEAIITRLRRVISLGTSKKPRLALTTFGPPEARQQGIREWGHVMIFVDCDGEVGFPKPGALFLGETV